MIEFIRYTLLCISPIIFNTKTCTAVEPPYLQLSADGEQEYTDVVVRRVGEELSLVCELIGDGRPRPFVWNYIPADETAEQRPYTVSPSNASLSSTLSRTALREADSGRYLCSAPPFSLYKHVEVQMPGVKQCARGAFSCGTYCVLALYVCDGRADCTSGEDEAPAMCDRAPCSRADKLNCSSGRCVPWRACCRGGAPLCRQPACCDEHPRYHEHQGFEVEYPPLFEDRHAPDDYGFIQSTIYTVTACALIFMIAVVLLVSAICKMQMKRAALRHYARAERDTARHYGQHYAQTARFPPCYEASRLLEDARPAEPASDTPADTAPTLQCSPSCTDEDSGGFALSRLSAVFAARYRQVPTQCLDVEMTDVHSSPTANSSPRRQRPLDNYRSPTFCETDDFLFNPETSSCGRDLNYMATPIEFFRRRTLRNLGNLTDTRSRPLTLQLGRFQLSIPRLGRRTSLERRPDTPNVAEMNIDDLDFVRLNSNETYTLNGRTIRLLGANFENYPGGDGGTRPPPYNEAMRYKLYGPPPEYLSRDGLNTGSGTPNTEEQARSNIEMPPCYEDLASGGDANANANANASGSDNVDNDNGNHVASGNDTSNAGATDNVATDNRIASVTIDSHVAGCNVFNGNVEVEVTENLSSVIDNLPAIDSDVNANETC